MRSSPSLRNHQGARPLTVCRAAIATLQQAASAAVVLSLLFGQAWHLTSHDHANHGHSDTGTATSASASADRHACGHHHGACGDPEATSTPHHAPHDGGPSHDHDCRICAVLAQSTLPVVALTTLDAVGVAFEPVSLPDQVAATAVPGLILARGPPQVGIAIDG